MLSVRPIRSSLLVRYSRKPAPERKMLREAIILSALTRFVIVFLPFRVLVRMMQTRQVGVIAHEPVSMFTTHSSCDSLDARDVTDARNSRDSRDVTDVRNSRDARNPSHSGNAHNLINAIDPHNPVDLDYARLVARSIRTASRRVPWKATCLVEAASAKIMLSRRGISSRLNLGVTKNSDGGLLPHAWLEAGDVVILGGDELEKYTVVSKFE